MNEKIKIDPVLAQALERSLLRIVDSGKHIPADVFLDEVKHIDRLVAREKSNLPPMFRHFVEKRSYVKALKFLRGEPVEEDSQEKSKKKSTPQK